MQKRSTRELVRSQIDSVSAACTFRMPQYFINVTEVTRIGFEA
jgi:hypothetical protein